MSKVVTTGKGWTDAAQKHRDALADLIESESCQGFSADELAIYFAQQRESDESESSGGDA